MIQIAVIGAGCIGLATAWHIKKTMPNAQVVVIADKFGDETTSSGAACFWLPHCLGNTGQDKQQQWSEKTFDHLLALALGPEASTTGTHLLSGYEFFPTDDHSGLKPAWWNHTVFGYRRCTARELELLTTGEFKAGLFYTTLKTDGVRYLRWLTKQLMAIGVVFVKRRINGLEELAEDYDLVANCCGIEAKSLVPDSEVYPIRGQLIRGHAPWVKHFTLNHLPDEHLVYSIPGPDYTVIGGTHQKDNWNLDVSSEDKQRIITRLHQYQPQYKGANLLSDWVGLRPCRNAVRLETEVRVYNSKNLPVVHNYGHGGGGVTLHWGCGEEAATLIRQQMLPASKL